MKRTASPMDTFRKPQRLKHFKAFIALRGCDVLPPTNQWEVLRFIVGGRTNIVYRDKRERLSLVGDDIGPAAESFVNGQTWVPPEFKRVTQPNGNRTRAYIAAVLERDKTDECFYCGEPCGADISLEHLLSRVVGGPNRLGNMSVAHADCNQRAGHLSVVEKVKLREQMHAEKAQQKAIR